MTVRIRETNIVVRERAPVIQTVIATADARHVTHERRTAAHTVVANIGARGPEGAAGPTGEAGPPGIQGEPGPTGPPGIQGAAATVDAEQTITGTPGTPASVLNVGSTSAAQFRFQIPAGANGLTGPRGEPGENGQPGRDGLQGPQGPQGPAGFGTIIRGNVPNWRPENRPSNPTAGDTYILLDPEQAPNRAADNSPAAAGDGMAWDGAAWFNAGPLRGPIGEQGPPGTTDHTQLTNRNAADQHTFAAIDGLLTSGDGSQFLSNNGTYTTVPIIGEHNELTGRDSADAHPIAAVTGLQTALDARLPLSGGTMAGVIDMGANRVTALGDATGPTDAVSRSFADARFVAVAGDAMTGGLGFGSANATGPGDLSRHISLHGDGYGFSVTANTLNHVAPGLATHDFYVGTNRRFRIGDTVDASALRVTNIGNAAADTDALNRQSGDARYVGTFARPVESANTAETNAARILQPDGGGGLAWNVADSSLSVQAIARVQGSNTDADITATNSFNVSDTVWNDSANEDTDGLYDADNRRFVAPADGLYRFTYQYSWTTGAGDQRGWAQLQFRINNGATRDGYHTFDFDAGAGVGGGSITTTFRLTRGQHVTLWSGGGDRNGATLNLLGNVATFMTCERLAMNVPTTGGAWWHSVAETINNPGAGDRIPSTAAITSARITAGAQSGQFVLPANETYSLFASPMGFWANPGVNTRIRLSWRDVTNNQWIGHFNGNDSRPPGGDALRSSIPTITGIVAVGDTPITVQLQVVESGGATSIGGSHSEFHIHSVGGGLPLAGGTLTGGLSLGSAVVATPDDLSRHLRLWGSTYGFSITNATLNQYVPAAAVHDFYQGDNRRLRIGTTIDAGSVRVTSVGDATADTDAVNRQTADVRYQRGTFDSAAPLTVENGQGQEVARWTTGATDAGVIRMRATSFPGTTVGGVFATVAYSIGIGVARLVVLTNAVQTNWVRDMTLTQDNQITRLNITPNATGAFGWSLAIDSVNGDAITFANRGDDQTGTVRATAALNANVPA